MKTKSTKDLLNWVNNYLQLNIQSLDELTNGAVFCQIFDTVFPNETDVKFINYFASNQASSIKNYKILQKYFRRSRVVRDVGNISLLVSGNKSELLDLLKFMFEYIRKRDQTSSKTSQTSKINPKQRRAMTMYGGSEVLPQRILGKLEQEFRVSTKLKNDVQQETYLNLGDWNGEKAIDQPPTKNIENSQMVAPRRNRPESAPATVQKLGIDAKKQNDKPSQDLLFVPPHDTDRLSISEPASPREPRTGALPQDYPFSHPVPFGGEAPEGAPPFVKEAPNVVVPQDLNSDRLKTVEWLTQNEPETSFLVSSGIRLPRKLQQSIQEESENLSQNIQFLSNLQRESETQSNALFNNQNNSSSMNVEFGGVETPGKLLQQEESQEPPYPSTQMQQFEKKAPQLQLLETKQNELQNLYLHQGDLKLQDQNQNFNPENSNLQLENQNLQDQNQDLNPDDSNLQAEDSNLQVEDQTAQPLPSNSMYPMNQEDDVQPDSQPPNAPQIDTENVPNVKNVPDLNNEPKQINTQPQSEVFYEVELQSLNNDNSKEGEQVQIVSQSIQQFANLNNNEELSSQENSRNEKLPVVQNVQISNVSDSSNVENQRDYVNHEVKTHFNVIQPLNQDQSQNFFNEGDDQNEKQDLFSRSCLQFMSETQLTPEPEPENHKQEQKFLLTQDFMDEYTLKQSLCSSVEHGKFPLAITPSQPTQEKQKFLNTAQLVLEIEADEAQKFSSKASESSHQFENGNSEENITQDDISNNQHSNKQDFLDYQGENQDYNEEDLQVDKQQEVKKYSRQKNNFRNKSLFVQQKQYDADEEEEEEECEIQIADENDDISPQSFNSHVNQFQQEEKIFFSDEEKKSPKEDPQKQKQKFKTLKSNSKREESRSSRSKKQKEQTQNNSYNQSSNNKNDNVILEEIDEHDRRGNSQRSLSPETEIIDFDEYIENQNQNSSQKQNNSEIQVGSSSSKNSNSRRRNYNNSGDKKSPKSVIKESFIACEAAIQLLSEGLDDFDNFMRGISKGESNGVNTSDEKFKIMRTIIYNFSMISCQVLVILYMLQSLLKHTIQEDEDTEYVTKFPLHVEKLKKIIQKCRSGVIDLQNCEQRSPKFKNSGSKSSKSMNDSILIRVELLHKKIQRVFLHVKNLDTDNKILNKSRKRLMSNVSIQEFIYLNQDRNVFCVGDTSLRKKEAGKIAAMYRKDSSHTSLNTNPLGKKHGDGFYKFKNGDEFKGEFFQDRMEGLGVYTFEAGGQYCGEWRKSIYEGIGAETFARGSKYEGQYMNGLRHGYGTCEYYNGDTYIGQWFGGCRQGVGLQKCEDGSQYFGEYKDGKRQGVGVYTFANNDRYMGQYDNDLPHGFGVYEFASGYKYQGEWQHGEKQGWCEYFVSSGEGVVALFKGNKRQWMVDPNNNQLSNEDNKRVQLSKKQSAAALKAKEEALASEKQLKDKSGEFWKRISQIKQKVQETEQRSSESARRSMYLYNNLLLTQEILGMGFKE